jgi:hypothetical protein
VPGLRGQLCVRAILPVDFLDGQTMPKKQTASKSSKRKPNPSSARAAKPEPKKRDVLKKQTPPALLVETLKNTPPPKSSLPARSPAVRLNLPAEAALSFLRDTKGSLSWSVRDLSHTLNISREEAERVVTLLQLQGYVQAESHRTREWLTTPSGETVSGAKTPRFERETVEAALTSLEQRIQDTNQDRAAKFQITRAVAFGDFLAKDRTRVQTAEVGIELARKDKKRNSEEIAAPHSAAEAREEQFFLRQLRGRSALITLKPYSEWMGTRTHQKLF